MAQLRDKQTSGLLAEGTPLEIATLASNIGFDEVIFDDVGLGFDPQAVIDAHYELLESIPSDASDEFKQQAADADKLPQGALKAATDALQEYRDAVENYIQG